MIHELKVVPPYFEDIVQGEKTFEFRRDDRGFVVGDQLHLREFVGETTFAGKRLSYTGRSVFRRVKYILHGGSFGVPEGYCVMGLEWPGLEGTKHHKPDCASFDFDPEKQLGPTKPCDCQPLCFHAAAGKPCTRYLEGTRAEAAYIAAMVSERAMSLGAETPEKILIDRLVKRDGELQKAEAEINRLRKEVDGLRSAVLRLDDRCRELSEKSGWKFWRAD